MKNTFRMAALGLAVVLGSAGFAAAQDWRYDRDNYGYDRGYNSGLRVAHDVGYQDGSQVAREDMWHGKPFNPYPRGAYRSSDHGYNRGYGDRGAYRDRYADGYRDGYMAAFRGNRGYDRDDYHWRR